jgi:hypothetical protein
MNKHAFNNPEDSFQSMNTQTRGLFKTSEFSCLFCPSGIAEFLQISSDNALPVCKPCKRLQRDEDHIFIPIKWKEIVKSTKELPEIQLRNNCLRQAHDEIDRAVQANSSCEVLEVLKYQLESLIATWIEEQRELLTAKNLVENERFKVLKKEVAAQVLKKIPDCNTEAGKVVNSILTYGHSNLRPPPPVVIPADDILINLRIFLEQIRIVPEHCGHYLFLFHPGKSNATRVNLEKLKKKEITFDRNWTFEASWLEMDNGQVFFCGGNGMNNSEVLMIDFERGVVENKKEFNGRSGHCIVQKDGIIYVFGGNKGKFAEKFTFATGEWENLNELPVKISRISACLTSSGILLAGNDYEKIFLFSPEINEYQNLNLDLGRTKNKILFCHNDFVYCMCGDKVYFAPAGELDCWKSRDIIDRDWWSYSKPVVFNNCAYFIKYFVRNLWCLNLDTFELKETPLSDIPSEDN